MEFINPYEEEQADKLRARTGKRSPESVATRTAMTAANGSENFINPYEAPASKQGGEERKSGIDELSDMPLHRQAMSGAVGPFETVLSMGSQIPAAIAGGLRGGYNFVTGEGLDASVERARETQNKYTYEPRSAAGRMFNELGGEAFDYAKEGVGELMNQLRKPDWMYSTNPDVAQQESTDAEAASRSMGEGALEFGALAGPVVGMRPKGRPAAPKAVEGMPKAPEMGFVDPDVAPSSVRNRPESDYLYENKNTELGTRPKEIGDLADDEVITDEGRRVQNTSFEHGVESVDARLREEEYTGPRQKKPVEDNSIDFAKYDPDRISEQVAAADKPGFMRSAEEVMRARELEKAEQETLRNRDRSNETLGARFAPAYDPAFSNSKLGDILGTSGDVREGLQQIAKESRTPWYRDLAQKLLEDKDYRPQFRIGELSDPRRLGEFDGSAYEIRIKPGWESSEYLFLHENLHARTQMALDGAFSEGTAGPKLKHLQGPVGRIRDLFDSFYEKVGGKDEDPYGLINVHEFVAEGFTNPEFQALLATHKLPKELRVGGLKSYWDAFVDKVAKLFGFKRESHDYLSQLLRAGADLLEGAGKDERTLVAKDRGLGDTYGAESGLELEPIKKEIEQKQSKEGPKGIMGAVMDRARDFALDKRSFDDFYKEDLEGKELQDFSPKSQNLVKRIYNRLGALGKKEFLQDTTIKLLMRNTEGTGPLIKWGVDQITRIDRKYMAQTKQYIEEALNPFRRMFRADKAALEDMRKVWMDNVGKRELGPADFKDMKQFEVYDAFRKVDDKILKEVNAKRAEAGLKKIERIPSHFHSIWEGDYRIFGYDAKGEKVWAHGYKTELGAERDVRKLREKHPDIRWEAEEVKRNKYGLMDLSAFEEALNVLSKDDPATKIIQQTYRDILQHRGFGKTGLHRKGVQGFLGETGDLKDMERAYTQYVEQANRYLSNLEKQQVLSDIQKLPKEQRDQIPMTMDFLNSYIHKARGGRGLIDWETKTLDELGSALGLGFNAPRNFVRGMGQVVYLYWLTTPRFLAAQSVQSINALPKLIQEHGTFSGTKLFFDGWKNLISPDAVAKEALDWATKRQYLDPSIRNLIGKPKEERPTTFEGVKEILTWPAALIEHHLVRAPVFLMFEKALRDTVKDKEQRFEIAGEKADYYMVNYNRTHAPAVYDNLGIAGEMLRPLKMYSHNYIGQFLEYVQGAKNKGEYAPLATFFGTQAMVAGLKGMMLVAEATIAINAINALFDTSIPTPEQALMKSSLHDALIFGGLSSILGRDVSSSVAAPGLPSMLNFPAVEFTVDMIKDVGHFAIQFMKGQETDQDRLKAWLAITPSAAHEWLRNLYTPEGQPVTNPNDPQGRGNYRRDEDQQMWSTMTGTKSVDEAKADALIRSVRKELMRDAERKLDAVDAIVDRIKSGQPVDGKLFQKYLENGGDASRLSQTVMERAKQRQLTGVERLQDHQVTPTQAHRLNILKEYLDKEFPAEEPKMFDPKTGKIVEPSSVTMVDDGEGGKSRLYNDTEGNPRGGFVDRMEERMQRMPQKYGIDPEQLYGYPFADTQRREVPERVPLKQVERNAFKRERANKTRKYQM